MARGEAKKTQLTLDGSVETERDEYSEFVDKFKPKKTTDDCYTPENVYDAAADWAANEYKIDRALFVRPFRPGGDYRKFSYPDGCVVVDNPPFSILAEIVDWYNVKGVRYFLFCPALVAFNYINRASAVCAHAQIVYENGASVCTSFLTNLDDSAARSAPALTAALNRANDKNLAARKRLPKYDYPPHVLTAARLGKWSDLGIDFRVPKGKLAFIRALDAQRECGKSVFGAGVLLADTLAAEAAKTRRLANEIAPEARPRVWRLSEREREICAALDGGED